MSAITLGFVLACMDCGDESFVGGTARFSLTECGERKTFVSYFAPDADLSQCGFSDSIGFSGGNGDTFQCPACWLAARLSRQEGRR